MRAPARRREKAVAYVGTSSLGEKKLKTPICSTGWFPLCIDAIHSSPTRADPNHQQTTGNIPEHLNLVSGASMNCFQHPAESMVCLLMTAFFLSPLWFFNPHLPLTSGNRCRKGQHWLTWDAANCSAKHIVSGNCCCLLSTSVAGLSLHDRCPGTSCVLLVHCRVLTGLPLHRVWYGKSSFILASTPHPFPLWHLTYRLFVTGIHSSTVLLGDTCKKAFAPSIFFGIYLMENNLNIFANKMVGMHMLPLAQLMSFLPLSPA